jgi:hypothetical protein
MSENRLKNIIGKEYTDNPIVNYLKYWTKALGSPPNISLYCETIYKKNQWLKGIKSI